MKKSTHNIANTETQAYSNRAAINSKIIYLFTLLTIYNTIFMY